MNIELQSNFKTLKDDLTFKYVFSQEEILKDLINSFLDFVNIKNDFILTNIQVQNYMLPNNQNIKGFFGDIVATLANGSIINIEMYKNTFTKREFKKSVSYLCKLYLDQMKKGEEEYEKIKKVIGISFINNKYEEQKELINTYKFQNNKIIEKEEEGDMELYLVRLDLINKVRYNEYRKKRFLKWAKMLNAKTIDELKEIGNGDDVMENSIRVVNEWLEEGYRNGLNNYIEEKEFEAEEKGSMEASKNIARNLLSLNMPIEDISKATGLTKNQILNIK